MADVADDADEGFSALSAVAETLPLVESAATAAEPDKADKLSILFTFFETLCEEVFVSATTSSNILSSKAFGFADAPICSSINSSTDFPYFIFAFLGAGAAVVSGTFGAAFGCSTVFAEAAFEFSGLLSAGFTGSADLAGLSTVFAAGLSAFFAVSCFLICSAGF